MPGLLTSGASAGDEFKLVICLTALSFFSQDYTFLAQGCWDFMELKVTEKDYCKRGRGFNLCALQKKLPKDKHMRRGSFEDTA